MDVFGSAWEGHDKRLRDVWLRLVEPEDTVIVAGDISWALRLQQALAEGHGIIPAMLFLRHKVDALEAITDDNVWPLPKYREMLFIC